MKFIKNNDIAILLFSLLVFSLGIGWIYSKTEDKTKTEIKVIKEKEALKKKEKKPKSTVPAPKKTPAPPKEIKFKESDVPKEETDFTTEEMLEYLYESGKSKDLKSVLIFLKEKCPKEKIAEVVKKFIGTEEHGLERKNKLKLILSLGKHYKNEKKIQKQLFDIIAAHKDIEEGEIPLLFLAVEIGEREAIPDVVEWYKSQKEKKQPRLRDLAKQTLEYAAKHDFDEALKKLHENGAEINKNYAKKLLWILIKSNAGSKSIEFLKKRGADLNNYDPESKHTILIQAIKNKNLDSVKKLVELVEKEGKEKLKEFLNKPSKDKTIGYPLQITRELKLLDIEKFIRNKGAKD